jgi:hypothetical protein
MTKPLLLVTGAGASRNLGIGEQKMPLMADWSNSLCAALDNEKQGLAAACRLERGMVGPEFEENLGLLLKFDEALPLVDRFAQLGRQDFTSERPAVKAARDLISSRVTSVKHALDTTLYDEFGLDRVDDEKATLAYQRLLDACGSDDLIVATTNYDRATESALAALNLDVDTGFRGNHGRTPRLDPVGLVSGRQSATPVIHLHGAVGWYESNGSVEDHYADKPLNESLGTPVVLYPDPDKDPTKDAAVKQLWTEFNGAADSAAAIVVVGHSLHDPGLVRVLRVASEEKPVVIGYLEKEDKKRVEREVPKAQAVPLEFGPEVRIPSALRKTVG